MKSKKLRKHLDIFTDNIIKSIKEEIYRIYQNRQGVLEKEIAFVEPFSLNVYGTELISIVARYDEIQLIRLDRCNEHIVMQVNISNVDPRILLYVFEELEGIPVLEKEPEVF